MSSRREQLTAGLQRLRNSRVLRDSSVIFAGNWVTLAVALVRSALLARILGSEAFGLVLLAMTSVNFVIQFIDLQTDEALVRFMGAAQARGERDEALTFFYVGLAVDAVVALIALVVVVLVVPPAVAFYPQGEQVQPLVWIFLLTTPFTILQSTFQAIFKTFKQFRLMTKITIASNLFSLVLLVLLATQGITALTWGYVTVTAVTVLTYMLVGFRLLAKNLPGARGKNYRQTWRQLMPFVLHTSFVGSLKSIAGNIDTLLLGAFASSSAVSYFHIARSAVGLIALPITPVSTVIYPLMNEAWAVGNIERVKYLIRRFMALSGAISVAGVVFFAIFADLLVTLIYSMDFLPVAPLIRIMSIGVALEGVMGWVRTAALSNGKPQLVTFTGTAASIIYIPLDFLLIYLYGAQGAALAYVAAVLMMVSLNVFYVLPRLGLRDLLIRRSEVSDVA